MRTNSSIIFLYINIGLVFISNILVFWSWFNISKATVDTMFMGLLLIPLIFVTIYYLGLLLWAYRLLQKAVSNNENIRKTNIALLLMNVVPMILIYKLTT